MNNEKKIEKKIGLIGGGNMASAMIEGFVHSECMDTANIMVSDKNVSVLNRLKERYAVLVTEDNLEIAQFADIIVLAVKPNLYSDVIEEIRGRIKAETIVVSIGAGQTIKKIEHAFKASVKVVRVMPNTPSLVLEGMSGIAYNECVSGEEALEIKSIFQTFGKAEMVKEALMDVVTGISGSSPAYVYLFIEAMADAAVAEGMPREQAYTFAAQAVLGAAKMVLNTKEHPGSLKDKVCSPGGTTIAAVCKLEEKGMRAAVISAVKACIEKSKEMSEH